MRQFLPVLLLLAAVPAQAEIYKWVDENGRTHFGEVLPDKYRKSSTTLNPQAPNTINGEALRGKGAAADMDTPASNTVVEETPATRSDAEKCAAEWERYYQSQACFAPYRNANGSLRSEASQACEAVPEPARCQ